MADTNRELAGFLKRARGQGDPAQAGLPPDGRIHRVPGLRREEVARLAGVSIDNYACHEQGRRITPSPVVVEALGRALGLDAAERAHLQDLIGVTAPLRRRPAASSVSAPGLYHGMNPPALTEVIRVGLYMIFKRRDRL